MPPRRSSPPAPGGRLDHPGPERPCRPPRARSRGGRPGPPRALVSSRSAGAPREASGCPRRPSITASARGSGPPPTACSIAARCPTARRCRGCRCGSTSWSSSRGPAGQRSRASAIIGRVLAPQARIALVPVGRRPPIAGRTGPLCYTPARSGSRDGPEPPTAPPALRRCGARSSHADRSDRDGAVPSPRRRGRSPATRSAEERTEQEVAHRAVRLDAAAARGRSPLRPPDPPLEPQDAPVHLRGAQRDPHHRPRPDRAAAGRRARVRPRDRRPRRAGPVRRAPRSRPRSRSPRRRPAPACRTSTSAGSAACSPTS